MAVREGGRSDLAPFLGILCLTVVAYASVFSAQFIWDDDSWLTGNPAVQDPHGLHAIWTSVPRMQYYPLTFTAFWVENRLFGHDPFGYHAVNVLLHALNAFLAGLILRSLRVPAAFWIAAIFAIHPVHVESVAWVTELKNLLSGFFGLASVLAYLRFDRERRPSAYVAALALFACALLSKTAIATLPAALAVVAAWRAWPLRFRDLTPLLPFVALAGATASITIALERGMVGVVTSDFGFTAWQRLLVAARAFLFYPYKLIVPYPLIFSYPRFDVAGGSIASVAAVAAVVAIAAVLAALWRRGRRGAGAAILIYGVMIFPALGFFDVYAFRFSFVADHFQYLASIPILALVAQGAIRLFSKAGGTAGRIVAAGAVLVLALMTAHRSRAFHDEATLWKDTIAKNPDSWIAHHNLATLQSGAGSLDDAVAGFSEAIRCKPTSAESYNGRGLAYFKQHQLDRSLADLNRAVELDASYPEAYLNRGQVLAAQRRFDEAIGDFDRFLASNPAYAPAYEARGLSHAQRGEDGPAADDLTHAVALDPDSAEIRAERGFVYGRQDRLNEALADFDAAARLDPSLPAVFVLRGGLYERLDGNKLRACVDWRNACRLGDCRLYQSGCVTPP